MQKWTIGNTRITKVLEQEISMPADGLAANVDHARLDEHKKWLHPDFISPEGDLRISLHSLIIESEGKVIVLDTCMGNDRELPGGFGPLHTSFLTDLESVVSRESVDYVLCTHLHFDHIGWNTMLDGDKWVPTFPNARYLFGREEYDHWTGGAEHGYLDLSYGVTPIVDAGLHELIDTPYQITGEVSVIPTPGHTPGHVSVTIQSENQNAVITGDMVHHPVQFTEPHWHTNADGDPAQSVATRREFIAKYQDQPVLVIGTHFTGPTGGHLVTVGDDCHFTTD